MARSVYGSADLSFVECQREALKIIEVDVATWEEFIERASSSEYVQNSPLLFRGQGRSRRLLNTTLDDCAHGCAIWTTTA
jgi:hypothetical protein